MNKSAVSAAPAASQKNSKDSLPSDSKPRTRNNPKAPWAEGSKSSPVLEETSKSSLKPKRDLSFIKRDQTQDDIKKHKLSTDSMGNPVQVELSFLSKKTNPESSFTSKSGSKTKSGESLKPGSEKKSTDKLERKGTSQSKNLDMAKAEEAARGKTCGSVETSKNNENLPVGYQNQIPNTSKAKVLDENSVSKQSRQPNSSHDEHQLLGNANKQKKTRPPTESTGTSKLNQIAAGNGILQEKSIDLQDIADEAARLHLNSLADTNPIQRTPSRRRPVSLVVNSAVGPVPDKFMPMSPLRPNLILPESSISKKLVSPENSIKKGKISAESSISTQDWISRQNSFKDHKSRLQNILQNRTETDQVKAEELHDQDKSNGEWISMVPDTIKLDDKPLVEKKPLDREVIDKLKMLFNLYKLGRRIQNASEEIMKVHLLKVKHNFGTTDGILQDLQKELEWAIKLEELLKTKPLYRAGDTIQQIDKILKSRVPEYAKSPDQERYHLCRWVNMEKLPKNRVMLWEDHIVTCFYMILVGKVEFFKLNKDSKLPLCVFQAGSMFGHARIKVAGATRTACAATQSETWMLTIDRDDFMSVGKKSSSESFIDPRANAISTVGIFSQIPDFFKKIAVFFHFQAYEQGEVILPANEKIDRIHFVISGSCKVISVVPLIAHSNYGKTVLKACPVRKFDYVPNGLDKLEEVEVETQNGLGPGDWIPYIPLPITENSDGKWTKESIFLYRFKNPSECQIVAEEKVVMASVPFEDFMDLALEDTLRKFLDNTSVNRYPMEDIQRQYLSQNAWEQHKQDVVREIVDKKAEKKGMMR